MDANQPVKPFFRPAAAAAVEKSWLVTRYLRFSVFLCVPASPRKSMLYVVLLGPFGFAQSPP